MAEGGAEQATKHFAANMLDLACRDGSRPPKLQRRFPDDCMGISSRFQRILNAHEKDLAEIRGGGGGAG